MKYAYSEMPSGADHSRLTSITYPDGYVLTYNYSSGLNDSISRLSSLSDSTGTLEAYSYMGLSTVVIRSHPQPGIDLTFVGTPGDAGDEYAGLDRFGRVVDQLWLNTGTSTATDEFAYGYDAMSNRLYRDNLVNSAFGELYSYDSLNQLSGFQRGTLNGTKTAITGTVARSQGWDYDAVGNFDSVTTNGGTPQTRSANAQNEVTGISGATTPTYDANGNMTGDETGRQFVYDAWNRLVVVKNSGGTTLESFTYDGLNRRVTQTAGGTVTDLYYSKDWQVLAEKVGSTYTQRYVWSPVYVDAMVLRDRDTDANGTLDERLWVQQDANWNVTALVNSSGSVVERDVYDPYGVQTVLNASWSILGSSAYSFQHGFQGMAFEDTAGLNVSRGRSGYSPTLAVWVQPDPIRLEGGDVRFNGFVGNNPTNATDPSGFQPNQKQRPLRVIAIPYAEKPSDFAGHPLLDATTGSFDPGTALLKKAPDGWVIVKYYIRKNQPSTLGRELHELVKRTGSCIEVLELSAHGGPNGIVGVEAGPNINNLAASLMNSGALCRGAHIYLNGCNTGLGGAEGATKLSNLTGCYVHGTLGLAEGYLCQKNNRCRPANPNDPNEKKNEYYPGQINATGTACFVTFYDGQPWPPKASK